MRVGVETVNVILSEYGADLARFPDGETVCRARPARPAPADQWRQTRAETQEEARQCERARRRRVRAWPRFRCAAVRRRSGRTIAGSRSARGPMSPCLPPRGSSRNTFIALLRWGQPYVDEGAAAYEKRYRDARVKRLAQTANDLGYQLVATEA